MERVSQICGQRSLDTDEMNNASFKAIAQRTCVGHAYSTLVRWGIEVEVFGCKVQPGQLIHADKHGFMVIPKEDEARLLEASVYMDGNECSMVIPAARSTAGKTVEGLLAGIDEAGCPRSFNPYKHDIA
ncbi:hypothetical protein MNQ98_05755 [Paenibacillus sp. N3/727]|uniref:RraA family protein n=1 Tax=Paenibacillus sp. N3/727 TaxID=2925845 RepID=UPI001F52BFA8|nr:hypothetical protein [Paenibacillus sp. N3/727]UNK19536.1 hypothetical protein MNQ98_05755 [Paenibacillus sp. N3/727]